MQSNSASDAAAASTKKAQRVASYPKAEAKLNREEAQQTKQLNIQESQEVASNSSGSGSMSASGSGTMGGSMSNSGSSSQPQ
jgi:serine protease inhibitor ecotin